MPKKFSGENSKAAAARAKKEAGKEAEKIQKQKAAEDAQWEDADKNALKKRQRKEEQERKKQEQLQKKASAKALLEEEMNSIKKTTKSAPPPKLTRAQIESGNVTSQKEQKKVETHVDLPLHENINRSMGLEDQARNVTEAIAILNIGGDSVDKHPEKRLKAAYNAYEAHRLETLKLENPSLRLSQLKQIIFKEWQKSPENPLNKLQQ